MLLYSQVGSCLRGEASETGEDGVEKTLAQQSDLWIPQLRSQASANRW